MKTIAIALGSLLAAAATAASADVYYRSYDPYWAPRGEVVLDSRSECWNPRSGHFERVRPGERQNDLDFSRCRLVGGDRYYGDRYYGERYYSDRSAYRESREECWNSRAGHFERVRPGERQDDLDYGRCRMLTEERLAYDPWRWR